MASHADTNERWEQVIRLISHDLRNPLTAVKLSAQLIEQEAARAGHAKEQRWATTIVRAAGRMDDMLQRLVEAERIRLGKIQLARQPVVLDELCREILSRGEPDLDGSRIQATLPEESVVVPADPQYIRQAILSLLRIALQEAGRMLVAVGVEAQGREARLWIRAPCPPEVPVDAASSGSGDAGGRGSGQAIAQHVARTVIECHGGCLQITRGEDGSLTFALALPLA
jgi:K+-sensing histidine kinase KdpD